METNIHFQCHHPINSLSDNSCFTPSSLLQHFLNSNTENVLFNITNNLQNKTVIIKLNTIFLDLYELYFHYNCTALYKFKEIFNLNLVSIDINTFEKFLNRILFLKEHLYSNSSLIINFISLIKILYVVSDYLLAVYNSNIEHKLLLIFDKDHLSQLHNVNINDEITQIIMNKFYKLTISFISNITSSKFSHNYFFSLFHWGKNIEKILPEINNPSFIIVKNEHTDADIKLYSSKTFFLTLDNNLTLVQTPAIINNSPNEIKHFLNILSNSSQDNNINSEFLDSTQFSQYSKVNSCCTKKNSIHLNFNNSFSDPINITNIQSISDFKENDHTKFVSYDFYDKITTKQNINISSKHIGATTCRKNFNLMTYKYPQMFYDNCIKYYANKDPQKISCVNLQELWDKIKFNFVNNIISNVPKIKFKAVSNKCPLCKKIKITYPPSKLIEKNELFKMKKNQYLITCNACATSNFLSFFFSVCVLCLAKSCDTNNGFISENPKYYKVAQYYGSPYLGFKMLCQCCYLSVRKESLNISLFKNIIQLIPPPLFYLKSSDIYFSSDSANYVDNIHTLYMSSLKNFNLNFNSDNLLNRELFHG